MALSKLAIGLIAGISGIAAVSGITAIVVVFRNNALSNTASEKNESNNKETNKENDSSTNKDNLMTNNSRSDSTSSGSLSRMKQNPAAKPVTQVEEIAKDQGGKFDSEDESVQDHKANKNHDQQQATEQLQHQAEENMQKQPAPAPAATIPSEHTQSAALQDPMIIPSTETSPAAAESSPAVANGEGEGEGEPQEL